MTKDQKLLADKVRKLYENTVFGSTATLINGGVLFFVLRDQVSAMTLRVWLGAAIVISIIRLSLFWCYKKSSFRHVTTVRWKFFSIASLFLSGVLWGSAALFLFPANSIGHQVFIAFVTGGMVAGAVGSFTAMLSAFYLFSFPALLPIALRFSIAGGEIHFAMGAMIFLFLLIMCLTALRTHRDFANLLSLRYENSELLESLKREVVHRKKAEEDLRERNRKIEEIVETRTTELKEAVKQMRNEVEARKRVARALEENRQRMRAIINSAPLIIWAVDQNHVVTFAEGKMLEKIALKPGELVGRTVSELFGNKDEIFLQTKKALAGELVSGDMKFRGIIFENRCRPIRDEEHKIVGAIGVSVDVTEQKKAQKALLRLNETLEQRVAERNALAEARARQLQALAVDLIEAEERERRRVAFLLHDDLQQILAATQFKLQLAMRAMTEVPELEIAQKMLQESIEKSRRLAYELSPPVLHHLGLFEALQWLSDQMRENFELQVELKTNSEPAINDSLKRFFFRSAQEFLFNTVKHAGAHKARIDLFESEEFVCLSVSDEGRGFDPDALNLIHQTKGFGLLTIRERANHIGGCLAISSEPGKGSSFTLKVPLKIAVPENTTGDAILTGDPVSEESIGRFISG